MTAVTRRGPRVTHRAGEEQQPAQLVVGAGVRAAVQRLHEIHVAPADRGQRADLVLAVLELPLLERRELDAECAGNRRAKLARRLRREDQHASRALLATRPARFSATAP